MQSSIASGSNRNLAAGFTNFLPDVEIISVDPNEFYSSSDDDEEYVNVDDDPAIVIVESDGSTSNEIESDEAGLNHISSLIPDNNLFDVIELNINDDMLPDLQYDDIFLANRNNEVHQFDLASYINGESTSMILSPLELPPSAPVSRRSFENRSSLARKRISFSADIDEEQTTSHLDSLGTQSTVNTLHNNRFSGKLAANGFRGKWIPCDNDINMYLNDDNSNDSDAAIATKFDVPTCATENPTITSNEPSNSMDAVINCYEVDEITIEDIKIERPPTPSSILITSEDSRCSTSSGDSGYRATSNEFTETSNENSPQHLNTNCENIVDEKSQSNENNVEIKQEETKPNTKRKLNIQEYLRRKTLKVASEQNATTKDAGLSARDTKSKSNLGDTARNGENGAMECNKSLYEEIIVVSMGCNTDISIPATPFIHPKNTEIAKSTALLCNIQSAVEKLNSAADTSKLSSSSLISSIQNEILKKTSDSVSCKSKTVQTPLENDKHDNENNEDETELEHGENKVIMHLPRDRIRPMNWSVSIQTEPYFQFPPLELLPPLTVKKSQSREFGEQSRDSQYLSQSHSSSESSSDESSDDDHSDSSSSSSISSSSSRASSRTYYKDGEHRRNYRERRSSNSSGYHTYGSSKRSSSPEERRIIYVGRIEENATKSELYRKFSKYGAVKQITLHRKEGNDSRFGFITFDRPCEAYNAIDDSSKNSEISHYSISFGGRRAFCRQKYFDLDNIDPYQSLSSVDVGPRNNPPPRSDGSFDVLLRQMKSKLSKQAA